MARTMNATTTERLLKLTGERAQERTADEARALKGALLDATRSNREQYTTLPGWETGRWLTTSDNGWIKAVLVAHCVSVPGPTELRPKTPQGGRVYQRYAIKYDFMPYAIVIDGAPDMARRILTLEIPEPRDPFLPPPGLTTGEVLDRIIGMTKGIRL